MEYEICGLGHPRAPQSGLAEAAQKIVSAPDGTLTIPALAHHKPSGSFVPMKSFLGGMQMHCIGGYNADYAVTVPAAGRYALTAQVVTVQVGQKLLVTANNSKTPIELEVPYTLGQWEQTKPIDVTLDKGANVLHIALQDGSRGVTVKHFTLKPQNP